MKMIIMKIMLIIYSMLSFMKTPMSMGILLLTQTTLMTLYLSKIMNSSWMSMVVFIMLIGGLLILFMYMSSIACNEKFKMNHKISFMFLMLMIPIEEMLSETQMMENIMQFSMNESYSFSKIYNEKTMLITIMLFIYMFLTMVVITKIVKIHKGPLRSKYE